MLLCMENSDVKYLSAFNCNDILMSDIVIRSHYVRLNWISYKSPAVYRYQIIYLVYLFTVSRYYQPGYFRDTFTKGDTSDVLACMHDFISYVNENYVKSSVIKIVKLFSPLIFTHSINTFSVEIIPALPYHFLSCPHSKVCSEIMKTNTNNED